MPTDVIVKTIRKDYLLMAGLLLASLIASLLVGAYLLGQANQGLELARFEAIESAELIQEQQQKIESMTFDLATLRLGESVSELASADLQAVVVQQQDRIARLENEAVYYRNLMSASAGDREVFVHRVDLEPDQQQGTLKYQIMLTHADPDGEQTLGRIELKIAGEVGARETTLDAFEAGLIDPGALDYQFRYFQNFSGQLKLPEGFKPLTLQLEVTSLAGQTLEYQVIEVPQWEV
jgi:hypothetical protein